ncbi:MAG: IS1595 family transposase [Desulfomonilaceae bacterium]
MILPNPNLSEVTAMTEDEAREYVESVLWPHGPICPHCGEKKSWEIRGESVRSGLYKCGACLKQFTVTVGTIMHGSHLSIRQWVIAFHLMTSSKKGVSALQLQRNLGLGSYKTAWFLAHRIRLSMKTEPIKALLAGIVEVDKTYVGGKPRKDNNNDSPKNKRGRGTDKVRVMVLVERNGKAFSKPIENVNHGEGELSRGFVYTNTAESYFSLPKTSRN